MKLLALAMMFACGGCGLIHFDVSTSIPEQTVAGSPLGGILPQLIAAPIPLQVDLKAEEQKRDTGPAQSAELASFTLQATPHGAPRGNWDFLDELHVYIAAANLPRVEVAHLAPVPKGQTTLELALVQPKPDLLAYINAGAQISADASGRQPAQTFTFDGTVVVTVGL